MIDLYLTTAKTDSSAFVRRILEERYAIASPEFYRSENGKPYLRSPSLFFNVSHSGDLLGAAFSENEIGLDVQKRSPRVPPAVLARMTSAEQKEDFYRVWTAKESYIKYRGGTLARMIGTLEYQNSVLYEAGERVQAVLYHCESDGCSVCICTQKSDAVEIIRFPVL